MYSAVCMLILTVSNALPCRKMILEYGLWDQVRVDQGKEWYLMLFVQEALASHRTNIHRPPHLQSSSTKVSQCMACKTLLTALHERNFVNL